MHHTLTPPLPQFTRLTSLEGLLHPSVYYEDMPHSSPRVEALAGASSLRRLLLYYRVYDDEHTSNANIYPAFYDGWAALSTLTPHLREVAVMLSKAAGPFPVLPHLRSLHLASWDNELASWPPDLSAHFPSLQHAIFGDATYRACFPPVSSLLGCTSLTRLCFFTTGDTKPLPVLELSSLSRLPALRVLELSRFDYTVDSADRIWYRPFAEFEAAVRAPQLTHLAMWNMFDEFYFDYDFVGNPDDEDPSEQPYKATLAFKAGWRRARDAVAAALRAAAAAGPRLHIEFGERPDWPTEQVWQACLMDL